MAMIRIGCAGWTIPRESNAAFSTPGSHLERYTHRFTAVEINSSFRQPHRRTTYERWAQTVPADFAFAVKAPKEITHQSRLKNTITALETFLSSVAGLGDKLGALLFQFPPSLAFDPDTLCEFCAELRTRFEGGLVFEPRHPSWFTESANHLLSQYRISRAAVDPPVVAAAAHSGGCMNLYYLRLHGSPRIYYSEYDSGQLDRFAKQVIDAAKEGHVAWCIFDNTVAGAAVVNALGLQKRVCTDESERERASTPGAALQ
jgi:uncharacterized protein YecE (DUF72 family)